MSCRWYVAFLVLLPVATPSRRGAEVLTQPLGGQFIYHNLLAVHILHMYPRL